MTATTRPLPDPVQRRGRLELIEVGRGLAALAVVLFHANASAAEFHGPDWAWFSLFEHGVDFFFVLSGFIILTAHRSDVGRSDEVLPYLTKRMIRLFPLLWAIVAGWTALRMAAGAPVDFLTVARSLLPYPSLQPTTPAVVWTLRHELLFYAIFALLIASPRLGKSAFVLWFVAAAGQLIAVLAGRPATGIAGFLLSTFSIDFFLGMAVAMLHAKRQFAPSVTPLIVGIVVLVITLVLGEMTGMGRAGVADYTSFGATWWTLAIGVIFAWIVHALCCAEPLVRPHRWLVALGAATYAIYLIHTPVNSVVQKAAAWLPSALLSIGAGHALLVIAGVFAGVAVHLGFERPLTLRLRQRLTRPRS